MAFYRTLSKDYQNKTRRFDFRFGITEKGFVGTFIFQALDNHTNIVYKDKIIGDAHFSLIAGEHPKFIIYVRKDFKYAGQNSYRELKFFETDITTGLHDTFKDRIYTGDYLQSVFSGEVYETFSDNESGDFYLVNTKESIKERCEKDYSSNNKPLTNGENYVIIGNRIEGIKFPK